jgi:UDP-N-acetylmuramoyl-L-alanyl-D-glutamate--2,6-diaminopimelate ligase
MQLRQLISALPTIVKIDQPDLEVQGLASDSRKVKSGDLFVAYKGVEADGHRYIPQAIEAGAAALVVEDERWSRSPTGPSWPIPVVVVDDGREALARLAASFHSFPSRRLRLIGVTGTDGKTTTVNLIWSVLRAAGQSAGLISSVNAVIGDEEYDTGLHTTTPDAPEVQAYLAQMVDAGSEYAVLETTSHGLAQHRVTGCDFDVAAITNLTHEHLDFHGTFEEYRDAKAQLFRSLDGSYRKAGVSKVAILNADDPSFDYLVAIPADQQLTYSVESKADFTAVDICYGPNATSFTARTPLGEVPIRLRLPGRFNVYNALATVAVATSQRIGIEEIAHGIEAVAKIPGRMESIDRGQPFQLLIDFAHTPNSLRSALMAAREMTEGRVTVVFGCAGLRDRDKRPVMGQIAGELADRTVITAEDPRTEDLDEIMEQIGAGTRKAGRREGVDYWRVPDRREAIHFAVGTAQDGDLVVITGKGHEKSMCVGTTELPWSDHQVAEEAIWQRCAREGGP